MPHVLVKLPLSREFKIKCPAVDFQRPGPLRSTQAEITTGRGSHTSIMRAQTGAQPQAAHQTRGAADRSEYRHRGKRTLGRSSCRTTWTTRLPCWKSLPLPTRGAHAVSHASQTRATQLARKPLSLRNLDDGARPTDRRPGRFFCFQYIDETDTIVFG
jgi:hypothetical protein